jgi:hypothetical protein
MRLGLAFYAWGWALIDGPTNIIICMLCLKKLEAFLSGGNSLSAFHLAKEGHLYSLSFIG